MTLPSGIENALVHQKDVLLRLTNEAKDAGDLQKVLDLLNFASGVWFYADYGYKIKEICDRILFSARGMLESEQEYLDKCRKNCKTRAGTLAEMYKLRNIIEACN